MAKEIVRFHTIIWPAMLMSLNEPLPKKVFGHGWLLLEGGKMSKSKGNVVDPVVLCDRYGVDAIRYFLLREIAFGSDGVFSNENLINRINFELANDLGNLLSRTVSMVEKYFGGVIPTEREATEFDEALISAAKELKANTESLYDKLLFPNALTDIWKFISKANKYIDETTPWILAKDEANKAKLASVMYNLCESLRIVSVLISPVMPETSPKIRAQLGLDADFEWDSAGVFGLNDSFSVKKGDIIFPRIDVEAELKELEKQTAQKAEEKKAEKAAENVALIGIEDFAKVSLRVAKVVACEPVKRAKKLLKLTLNDGERSDRTVASGIAQWYRPEDLIGRNIILVDNLKPAVLCGVESQGMILAADAGENDVKVIFADDIPAGSKVR